MKNLLFICAIFIFTTGFTQTIEKDSVILSFENDLINMKYVTKINYCEYMSSKAYIYTSKNLNTSLKLGFNNKKLYIRNYNYFFYRERNRKYKFIY